MDLNSTYAPPINNACVPDIYNRLDADVIERTRVANNQLNIRLLLEQRILLKYKQEAERFLMVEKSRVCRELARITQRLPTVVNLQAFDESVNQSEHAHQHKKRSYMTAKNDDPVCHRCYIHHLPSKKQFYRFRKHQPLPAVLEANIRYNIPVNHQHDQNMATKSISSNTLDRTGNGNVIDKNDSLSKAASELSLHDQSRKLADRFIPAADAFKFLDRDKWGREIDPNHNDTPRLMPNELWKNFVKTISSQYSRHQGIPTSRNQHGNDIFFREKTADKISGINGRRSSIVSGKKSRERSEKLSRSLSKSNSRINLNRRASIAAEQQPSENTHANSTATTQEINTNINARKKPRLSKTNSFSRSLSRDHLKSPSTTPR